MIKKFLLSLLFIFCIPLLLIDFESFGGRPNEKEKSSFHHSKNFNKERGLFKNLGFKVLEEIEKDTMKLENLIDFLSSRDDRIPKGKLPELKPDLEAFAGGDEDKVIWLGHSSILLRLAGKFILIDPVFAKEASPVHFFVTRFQDSVIKLSDLPQIDIVLISHDHYDHLDMKSIKFFRNKETRFIVPLGVGVHLRAWGVQKEKIVEKDWWESYSFGNIKFIATPAQHFSGRDGVHINETLWSSWVIKSDNLNLFFSGDSGYGDHFKKIGKSFGPFDVVFMETGQYHEKWKAVHMTPEEALMAFRELKGKWYFPIHWGMFKLSTHSWYEPVERLSKKSDNNDKILAPLLGEVLIFNKLFQKERFWWKDYISK